MSGLTGSRHGARPASESSVLARIPKGGTAELRVTSGEYKGRRIVDFRLWYVPEGQEVNVATGKGIAIDAEKMQALMAQLQEHFPPP